MPRARAIVTVVVAAAIAATGWSAFRFLHEPESRDASSRGAAALDAATSTAHESATSSNRSDAASDHGSLAPTVTAVNPRLEWPDEESLRQMERGGRALFGGIVRAPDGSACPGATVWFDGEVVAKTDTLGSWRAYVSCFLVEEEGVRSYVHVLEARKEHVGHKRVSVELPSRRIDLDLVAGLSFSGTVVDFDDGTPIGGAELELRRNSTNRFSASFTTRSDALGRFAFTDLPEGAVYVRGRAPGYDSNGFLGYDFSKGRDVVVAYRLRREFTLRGRFVPWPIAGVDATKSSVRATTKSPHDRGNKSLEYRGPIGSDGRFELPAPVCPTCVLDLLAGDQPYWTDELDTNEERREFDVGDIALLPAAALVGRFQVPDAELRERIVASASVTTSDGRNVAARTHLDAAGGFRLDPLPPGTASVSFSLGRIQLATLETASDLSADERDAHCVPLVGGVVRDVGVVATLETVCFGTVRDADGMPVAWADLDENLKSSSNRWIDLFSAHTDAEGRFVGLRDVSRADEDVARALAGRARWQVTTEGRLSHVFEFECPATEQWVRRDLVLEDGVTLRGTLVDDAGAPCGTAMIMVMNVPGAEERFGSDTTRADGSFEILGLTAGAYRIFTFGAADRLRFDDVHPENGPVTLRPADAAKQ